MKDIIQEARELLEKHAVDFWGVKQHFIVGVVAETIRGLLERIEELQEVHVPVGNGSPETLLRLLDENRSLELQLEQAQQERDAALERVLKETEAPHV